MPLELVAVAPRQPVVRAYEDRPPGPGEVHLRSTLATEKHGTMLQFYRNESPFTRQTVDGEHGLFMPLDEPRPTDWSHGMPLGNTTAGVVEALGEGVTQFAVGDRAYGYLPIRETHTVPAERLEQVPDNLTDDMIACLDPAMVAFTGIREAKVVLGETVAVFGAGAIGLMTIALAKLSGAALVIAVEPLPLRANLARECGADLVFDLATNQDAGLRIREATGMLGVDIGLETSGNHRALHHAIRGTRYAGTIVPVAWYHGEAVGLELGDEWHLNRHTMVSGARLESVPYRDYPRWDPERVRQTIIDLFTAGKLPTSSLLQPRVTMAEVAEAYRGIDEHPENTVKLTVEF